MRYLIILILLCAPSWATQTRYVNAASSGGDCTTNATSGATAACATLAAAEALMSGTLSEPWIIYCEGTTADTTVVSIGGMTPSATNTITIMTTGANRHSGTYSTSLYRLEPASGAAITVGVPYVIIDGLQIKSASGGRAVFDNTISTNGTIVFKNNIILGTNDSGDRGMQLISSSTSTDWNIYNNIFYNLANFAIEVNTYNNQVNRIYNNTIYGCYGGIYLQTTGTIAKNNLIIGSGNTNTYTGTFASGTDYNATDSTDDIGTGSNNKTSVSTTNLFVSTTNFHLTATSSADVKDAGVSDPGSGMFSTDIDGETRSGSWDIGADEYPAASTRRRVVIVQ
jgi:hypothetical protein